MTEKENFLMLARGQQPEWVPRYGIAPPDSGRFPACAMAMPSALMGSRTKDGGTDIFGVTYTPTDSTGGAALPTPNEFILKDITKWRDVIHVPDISNIDWEAMAAKDTKHINRNESALQMGTHVGYFQHLMAFMGFTEGMCAMIEEPEEVMALFEYLADFYDEVLKKSIKYYKPELVSITDDTATAKNPFISPKMYRELVKPYHARLGEIAMNANLIIDMHNCGRCEDFIEDWMDFGVSMWNPAQVVNDLVGIKKKYGNKLVLVGCWDSQGPVGWPDATEEFVRSEVRRCMDTFAPGGGFAFWGSVLGSQDDPSVKARAAWIDDECTKYGHAFYKTH